METGTAHILVVDDEINNREIICEILEDEGYEFSMAENGAVALEMLNADPEKFDVILLDRMMPVLGGMEVLAEVKSDPILRHCPVILQTARAAKDEILEGIKAGAYYYLAKPFEDEMLLSIVKSAVEERSKFVAVRDKLNNCTETMGCMDEAAFRFQGLEEIQHISFLLATACPEAEKVINGLTELMINAVEHGNLGIAYEEKSRLLEAGNWKDEVKRRMEQDENKSKYAQVKFQRKDNEIEIKITDQGKGFDWQKYMAFDPERATDNHGRGIAMANCLSFSRVEYEGAGNVVKAYITED